jgi:hypothetical protein
MSDPGQLRASDAGREQAAQALRRHLLQRAGGAFSPFVACTVIWVASGAHSAFWPVWLLIFPLVFLTRNVWRLHGPAPELDRVQAELQHRGHRRDHRRGRRSHRRELP